MESCRGSQRRIARVRVQPLSIYDGSSDQHRNYLPIVHIGKQLYSLLIKYNFYTNTEVRQQITGYLLCFKDTHIGHSA